MEEVKHFWVKVYNLLIHFIQTTDYPEVVNENHPLWSILMGLEHDRIHIETSSMLIRQYPVDWVTRPEGWKYAPTYFEAPENDWLSVPATEVKLGKPDDFPTFGWDNEYGSLPLSVKEFEASRSLITNAEFEEFVKAGGYTQEGLWTEEGWTWRSKFEVTHPKFWVPEGGSFRCRAMFDELAMPLSWPAEVNRHEAEAYCTWQGARLLTEGEFQAITQTATHQPFDVPYSDHFNVNLKYGSSTPVGLLPEATSHLGFNDAYGNVWCWLSNDFSPLPGYEAHAYTTWTFQSLTWIQSTRRCAAVPGPVQKPALQNSTDYDSEDIFTSTPAFAVKDHIDVSSGTYYELIS